MNFERLLPLLRFLLFLEFLHPSPRVFEFLCLISLRSGVCLKNLLIGGVWSLEPIGEHFILDCFVSLTLFLSHFFLYFDL